ncbi:anks1b [Symbiodinium natans]|uniref:Anks1b protein n=1 Tax=Symbiodinium natans TaxID=878477 RepID=A0A812RU64_9DINO|nr:anks1b [Symbiodinium natans]
MGKAGFVSHQWVSDGHPDPEMQQMKVLQETVRHLTQDEGTVPLDIITELSVRFATPLDLKSFQVEPFFLWYDYFSVPQLGPVGRAEAIMSIPAYVVKCSFFFALVPFLADAGLSATSWSRRGWCRMERVVQEISSDHTWILVKCRASMEVAGTVQSFLTGPVGEGEFTFPEDRDKLGPVLKGVVTRKLWSCLRARDFPGYRRHLGLQAVYFRGLPVDPEEGLVPGFHASLAPSASDLPAAKFLYQNGLRSAHGRDSAGWRPLHYAALGALRTKLSSEGVYGSCP